MVSTSKDLNGKVPGDECPTHDPVGKRYPSGTEPALSKDYGNKNDGELVNDLVPSVRKTGPLG